MAVTDGSEEPDSTAELPDPQTTVSAHRTSPDRLVFTEEGNTDGWIATDLTVDLER